MTEKPLVSIIIPTYNRAELLKAALDSVCAQEGSGEQFYMEVIVVDDASTDGTADVVRKYSEIQYIRLPVNRDHFVALNRGIEASKGEYIALLDDDNAFTPTKLLTQVEQLETQGEYGVVYGQTIMRGGGRELTWPDPSNAPSGFVYPTYFLEEFEFYETALIRRTAFEKAGYFDENLQAMGHYDIMLRLALHVPFLFVPGHVAVCRIANQGKWLASVLNGVQEQALPYVVERALTMLPDGAIDHCRVRVSVFSRIANTLRDLGDVGRRQGHFIRTLQKWPWMLTEPSARACIMKNAHEIAHQLAHTSESPITAVRGFCMEIRDAVRARGLRQRLQVRQILSEIWMQTALRLRWSGSPRLDRSAACASTYAIIYNPAMLTQASTLKVLVRGLLANTFLNSVLEILDRIVG